ncbi:MAG: Phosphoribosyl pyrophosphate synthase, partial [Patescibacteria group bacterium]|nr:Phosphoribosyl pyrophosphate synthase [Patescibacteria group bacterium]
KLLSGSSNLTFATALADKLSLPLVETEFAKFANSEHRVWIKEALSGEDVVVVQSLSNPTDENIMELLLLLDAVERLGAREVHAVIPWLGYSLQDKVFRPGEPIAVKVVANLISNSYVRRVYLMDVHNTSIPGFFSIPTTHISASTLFLEYSKKNFDLNSVIVASPDFGGLKRARQFASDVGVDLVNIDKHRDLHSGNITSAILHGDVKDKTVLIYDDTIQSGGTVKEAAETLKDGGAKEVHFLATHGPMVPNAFEIINAAPVDSVVVTNSVEQILHSEKVKLIDSSVLFLDAIEQWL